ncbi:hypothetical protein Lal_00030160 [Lupinus albus]|nr:hypothetical protein Lal_00030160 [Lupinus albus]
MNPLCEDRENRHCQLRPFRITILGDDSKGTKMGSSENLSNARFTSVYSCEYGFFGLFCVFFLIRDMEGKLNDALFGLVDLRSLPDFIGRALHSTI